MKPELTIILGPTAVGKTDYSINLAQEYGSPIVSCDSRQIFREMKIGTAPPDDQQMARVKHYFIHSHSVEQYYTAGMYELEALSVLDELFKTHEKIVMTGGSGLYIDALCNGLDDFPETDMDIRRNLSGRLEEEGIESLRMELKKLDPKSYYEIDIANKQRVLRALEVTIISGKPFSSFKKDIKKERPFTIKKTGLIRNREQLYGRIDMRVDKMIEDGLLEEVKSLEKYRNMPALNTVGYKELFEYIDGKISFVEAVRLIKRNTRHYAKRQISYWGRDKDIEWIKVL